MSKKRKREVDVELVKVYDDLADNHENVRLAAAHTLVSKIFKPGITSAEQTKSILTRLFRGLCSSRKSARLGFSVALTELLSQIPYGSGDEAISASDVVDILDAETVPEGGTSGQDERDHHFGRIFGSDAILKSAILFKKPDSTQWNRLLDIVCALALKKPWLRQECGWVLCSCVASSDPHSDFVVDTVNKLSANKLIRTPEGVAVWLSITQCHPETKLPKNAWKFGDPLSSKDAAGLADILKDARTQSDTSKDEFEAQGSAGWSPNLHFAWDVVLGALFRDEAKAKTANGHAKKPSSDRISFENFWKTVVDESLFATSSSAERKAWGLSLWRKVFEAAPPSLLPYTFTPNALRCLVNSLKSSERFLQKSALRTSQVFSTRIGDSRDVVTACIKGLLSSVNYVDFDQFTKSKTVQSILEVTSNNASSSIYTTLQDLWTETQELEDKKSAVQRQKAILHLEVKLFLSVLRAFDSSEMEAAEHRLQMKQLLLSISQGLTQRIYVSTKQPSLLPEVRDFAKERLAQVFEQALKTSRVGAKVLRESILVINRLEKQGMATTQDFSDQVQKTVDKAWKRLHRMSKRYGALHASGKAVEAPELKKTSKTKLQSDDVDAPLLHGLSLLYSLVLFQVYNGEAEAVEILQELLDHHERIEANIKDKPEGDDQENAADSIVEILLSFASRPSKFLRRITVQIFDAFAPEITSSGLESLCRVLATKENAQGQEEMFQTADVEMEDVGEDESESDSEEDDSDDTDEELDSDVEIDEIGSDVEVESASGSAGSSGDEEGSASDDSSDDDDDDDEELAAFDKALASALGTHLSTNDAEASASDSDADMTDSEMLALDEKLAEVFRARQSQQTKSKKKDAKDAKENIINFKNRVLDLLDSYLKHQATSPLAIEVVTPLLALARTSSSKQLADRAIEVLRNFCSRAKGTHLPTLTPSKTARKKALQILRDIHNEAALEASNAQKAVASQCSILLVKVMVGAAVDVKVPCQVYEDSRVKWLSETSYKLSPGFFTDWNNWCVSAREKSAK